MNKINYEESFYDKEVVVDHPALETSVELDIELKYDDGTPDCKVGHFGCNFWYRTPKGIAGEKYTSRKRLELAVERILKTNDFIIKGWSIKR